MASKRILIVDDEENIGRSLRMRHDPFDVAVDARLSRRDDLDRRRAGRLWELSNVVGGNGERA
jgi:hypothetical protein